jgi:hypothetical protein
MLGLAFVASALGVWWRERQPTTWNENGIACLVFDSRFGLRRLDKEPIPWRDVARIEVERRVDRRSYWNVFVYLVDGCVGAVNPAVRDHWSSDELAEQLDELRGAGQ